MTVELLEGQGLKVFTNRTGSNFARGITAAILEAVNWQGKLNADVAVLELDEAHAVKFAKNIRPRHCLLLNVMRDQLDRFGEIDNTAKMLQSIAQSTTQNVVLNREDPRVSAIASTLSADVKINYFGLAESLRDKFPSDDNFHAPSQSTANQTEASVVLESFSDAGATFTILGQNHTTNLQLRGVYNIYNAAAAMAITSAVVGDELNINQMMASLAQVKPAFGRGETININGVNIDLVLVKNPAGFDLALKSFSPDGTDTMIAINDNYADGRDMSWLWDVDFTSLGQNGVKMVSGIRAYDMALRLDYDDVKVDKIDQNISRALDDFMKTDLPNKRIYCTYTAMLKLRKILAKQSEIEDVL